MEIDSYEQIPPHTYPLLIKCGAIFCFFIFALFFYDLPHFIEINTKTKKAELAFEQKDYKVAFEYYSALNKQLPDRKHIKLRLAEILFTLDNTAAHKEALTHLKEINLKENEWNELLRYMPKEYVELFDTVKVQS